MADSVVFTPVRELGELVRTKQVSPVEVAQAFIARIEAVDPRIGAFVTPTPELALEAAKAAEAEIAAGGCWPETR